MSGRDLTEGPGESREPGRPGAASDLFSRTGKVALVTGDRRGLGREMVLAFAGAGADAVITSRRIEACRCPAATH